MGPTASGEVVGCQIDYTVQSGDTCYNIETTYGISLSQFYAWNPSSMFKFLALTRHTSSRLVTNQNFSWKQLHQPLAWIRLLRPGSSQLGLRDCNHGRRACAHPIRHCIELWRVLHRRKWRLVREDWYAVQWDICRAVPMEPGDRRHCQYLWMGYAICVGLSWEREQWDSVVKDVFIEMQPHFVVLDFAISATLEGGPACCTDSRDAHFSSYPYINIILNISTTTICIHIKQIRGCLIYY